ncbi:U4/U6 small nuclear ribonucleoprotein Prp31-like [Vespula maculifrons]|uniref:U4/U6 small nuclear ribonucleoprotein Prp31-like n=1 Tax=Vespula maculifrons TaxID=7453 RepID=A0ABD2B153_VESMC
MLILSSADKLKDMEDKCNSGESHGAKTKEPDFLLTSNTYKSIKEDEYLESRASFVGPSLSVTIRVSKPPKIIGFICHSIILLETPSDLRRDTTRLATAKGASIACVDASHKRKNGHFGQSRTNGPDFLSPNTLLCIKERFTKRNGKTCQRCINSCSDIDASQKGTNDNIDIILNKEPGEQLLEMFQLLEKDV